MVELMVQRGRLMNKVDFRRARDFFQVKAVAGQGIFGIGIIRPAALHLRAAYQDKPGQCSQEEYNHYSFDEPAHCPAPFLKALRNISGVMYRVWKFCQSPG